MLDLVLAVGHHLSIFALFGVLVAELVLVRKGLDADAIKRVANIDLWYGILAGVIVAFGFSRAVFAAKGWDYYQHNAVFWAKIFVFVVIGLLSVPPTLAYIRWRKPEAPAPSDSEIVGLRRLLWLEVALFALLPILAAAMARGYGQII